MQCTRKANRENLKKTLLDGCAVGPEGGDYLVGLGLAQHNSDKGRKLKQRHYRCIGRVPVVESVYR